MTTVIGIVLLVLGIAGGTGAGYAIRNSIAKNKAESAEAKANKIINDAKAKEKDLLLRAKEKAISVIDEGKKEEHERRRKLSSLEDRLTKREEAVEKRYLEIDSKREELVKKADKIRTAKKQLEDIRKEQLAKLEKISGFDKDKAKEVLLKNVEKDMGEVLTSRMEKLERQGEEQFEDKAKEILNLAVQRIASSHTSETTATTIPLPSDEMKGRIIGREGRNIKAIENLTGVEIVVDDTPEAIVISGFSPIRRQIAKLALEKLIHDGRIHPSRIEDAVKEAKAKIAKHVKEAGEAVVYDLGITGVDPKIIQLLGRLKFRTSYGQNVLKHTLEVAHLSGIIATELGLDVKLAKEAALYHDIGKAVDHEVQGTHTEIGANLLKKFGIDDKIIKTAMAHHEDIPYETPEARVIQAADAISASRPGARKDSYEDYIKRLEDLEKIATSFEGVEKSYAIQAGREIRVFVQPEEINDAGAKTMAKDIAGRIEEELKYPGEIKVHVIRETRVVDFAR